jgi:hypothetical protein
MPAAGPNCGIVRRDDAAVIYIHDVIAQIRNNPCIMAIAMILLQVGAIRMKHLPRVLPIYLP